RASRRTSGAARPASSRRGSSASRTSSTRRWRWRTSASPSRAASGGCCPCRSGRRPVPSVSRCGPTRCGSTTPGRCAASSRRARSGATTSSYASRCRRARPSRSPSPPTTCPTWATRFASRSTRTAWSSSRGRAPTAVADFCDPARQSRAESRLCWVRCPAVHAPTSVSRDECNGTPSHARPDRTLPATWRLDAIAHTARPSSLALSPDGTQAAFVLDGDAAGVWLLDLAGGGSDRLTTGHVALDGPPCWSPDGTRLAYTQRGAIYVVPVAGGPPGRITDGEAATWLDGDTLVVTTLHERVVRLAAVALDDPWPRPLARRDGDYADVA